MTAGAIVFGIFAMGVVAFLVLRPIFEEKVSKRALSADELSAEEAAVQLRTRLEGLILSIHDLDFDFDTGKVSKLVYAEQRKLLIGRAISTLIQLDQAEARLIEVDDEIEQAVARFRTVRAEVAQPKHAKRVSV